MSVKEPGSELVNVTNAVKISKDYDDIDPYSAT